MAEKPAPDVLHRLRKSDLVRYFGVTPPSAHDMVAKLEALGLVTRKQGVPRSVCVAIPDKEIPVLNPVKGPAW